MPRPAHHSSHDGSRDGAAETGASASAPTYEERVGAKLGVGRAVSEDALVELILGRLPLDAVAALTRHGFTEAEVHRLVLPRRTLSHRRTRGEPLSREESDRAVRVARIAALAETVFAHEARAGRWLRKPKERFCGHTPLQMLATEAGARRVEEMLYQIDEGIAA
jgi:putative toxin-antitoxin system antitoxin component (TIGR02293 family)